MIGGGDHASVKTYGRASWGTQLSCLLRKNWLLKKRLWKSTAFEILVPVIVMVILVGMRLLVEKEDIAAKYYDDEAQQMNGLLRDAQMFRLGSTIANKSEIMAFSPSSSPEAVQFHDDLVARYPVFAGNTRFFDSSDAITEYCKAGGYPNPGTNQNQVAGAVTFDNNAPPKWSYELRFNSTFRNDTSLTASVPPTGFFRTNPFSISYSQGPWRAYFQTGFLLLQSYVDAWIIEQETGQPLGADSTITATPFPVPSHTRDIFESVISDFTPLLLAFAFLWPVTRLVRNIVVEKEFRIKEGMQMMGLRGSALWVSWFVTYLVMFSIVSLLITLVTSSTVYEYSDKGIIFVLFFLFGLNVFAFSFFMSSLFSRATIASTTSALLFLALTFISFAIDIDTMDTSTIVLSALSPPVAFGLANNNVQKFESAGVGIQRSNLSESVQNAPGVDALIVMLMVDFVLFMLLALYLNEVVASKYGVSKPWYFLCSPKYWCRSSRSRSGRNNPANQRSPLLQMQADEDDHDDDEFGRMGDEDLRMHPRIEDVGPELQRQRAIRVRRLRKEFPREKGHAGDAGDANRVKLAVDNISMDMYRGQIFALLGHNGAGKTTTINMLTGMLPVTSGQATVEGQSILDDMTSIRSSLGVCPQHNILFDLLTVREHLVMYARIKGVDKADVNMRVEELIRDVGLTEKADTQSGALSGGMQRKLSVAIAFIGGSKVVFLDEPTSGMDPYSRRSTWDLLKRMKKGRVIVLTTHFMDEADQLGDRIAIMAKGSVQCCGTPLYLKASYGVGYTMTVTKGPKCDDEALQQTISSFVAKAKADRAEAGEDTKGMMSEAEVLSDVAAEVSFRLQFRASPQFPDMFDTLDANLNKLGINTYGISVTTLEEVFLKVGHGEENLNGPGSPRASVDVLDEPPSLEDKPMLNGPFVPETGRFGRFGRHFAALVSKRFHAAKRDKKGLTWQILYPAIALVAGLALLSVVRRPEQPALAMNSENFEEFPLVVPFNEAVSPDTVPFMNALTDLEPTVPYAVPSLATPADMSTFLMETYEGPTTGAVASSRYGALYLGNLSSTYDVSVHFNTTAFHALPVYFNLFSNGLARSLSGNNDITVTTVNFPLPLTVTQDSQSDSLTALTVGIAFAFVPASFVRFVVYERETRAKHQQFISGVSTLAYWLSNLAWDMINFSVPVVLLVILLLAFDIEQLVNAYEVYLPAMLLYGLSVSAFSYLASFAFKSSSSAQNLMLLVYIISGGLLYTASVVMDTLEVDENQYLKYVYRLLPCFCLAEVTGNLILRETALVQGDGIWSMDVTGTPMVFMFVETIVYFLLVLLVEYVQATPAAQAWFSCSRFSNAASLENYNGDAGDDIEEDDDVKRERELVLHGGENHMIQLQRLRKVYPGRFGANPKVAVRDLTFGIPNGECFGFLGINGAGKTTTLQMLTGALLPTRGTAQLAGHDIRTEQVTVRQQLGYCPQFDALIDQLTARETLRFYARLKLVPAADVEAYVSEMIDMLNLNTDCDQPCGGYSGGNKRKLSVGVALIGDPPIVFLDEPSTGMDPASRRFMWDVISATMQRRSVILTTHSMEEAEALCGRIGIMVGGRLRCIGSSQHLKERFGNGYQLDVALKAPNKEDQIGKFEPNNPARDAFVRFIEQTFPGADTLEVQGNHLKFRVPKIMTLGAAFRLLEERKQELHIVEYSVSDTTLESIFIHFAKQQQEERGAVAGLQ